MSITNLDTRRKSILQAIVEIYIETALPVSSQAIIQRLRWRLSTATVRNIMDGLDQQGLVWQPHTSAGRVPTDEGYRYYINSLLGPEKLTRPEMELPEPVLFHSYDQFDELLKQVLRALSNFAGYTSLAFFSDERRLYIERVSCILEHPEFQDVRKLQPILKIFDSGQPLLEIMKDDLHPDGIKVHIGKENSCCDIQECSLVVSNFKVNNQNTGCLGIIGPRRMPYARAISLVDYMARVLNEKPAV